MALILGRSSPHLIYNLLDASIGPELYYGGQSAMKAGWKITGITTYYPLPRESLAELNKKVKVQALEPDSRGAAPV